MPFLYEKQSPVEHVTKYVSGSAMDSIGYYFKDLSIQWAQGRRDGKYFERILIGFNLGDSIYHVRNRDSSDILSVSLESTEHSFIQDSISGSGDVQLPILNDRFNFFSFTEYPKFPDEMKLVLINRNIIDNPRFEDTLIVVNLNRTKVKT